MIRRTPLLLALALFASAGCLGGPQSLPNPRGVRVPDSDVPDAVLQEFKSRSGEAVRTIERLEDGNLFRLETESGSILFIDRQGNWRSTVI